MLLSIASTIVMTLFMRLGEGHGWSPLLFQASNVVQQFALVPLQCIGSLGLMRMMLDVVTGRSPTAGRFFSETRLMPRALAIQLPLTVVTALPGTLGVALQAAFPGAGSGAGAGVSCVFLPLFAVFGLSLWLFSIPELLISDCTAAEAMQRAFSLGSRWRNLRVLGYAALAGVLGFAGVLACGVGVLAGLPFGTLLVLSLFLALRSSSGLPGATSL